MWVCLAKNKAIFLCSEKDDIWKGTIFPTQHVMQQSVYGSAPEQGYSFFAFSHFKYMLRIFPSAEQDNITEVCLSKFSASTVFCSCTASL